MLYIIRTVLAHYAILFTIFTDKPISNFNNRIMSAICEKKTVEAV